MITRAHINLTPVAFENWGSFIRCITKIDRTTIDHAEYLDFSCII